MLKMMITKTAPLFLAVWALIPSASIAIEDCGTSVTECELRQEIKDLKDEIKALKALNDKVTALEALISSQAPKTENCTTAQKGQIRFDGTYARLCNGKDWQVIDARQSKPVLKQSDKKYSMAEVRKKGRAYDAIDGKHPKRFGQGSICEIGYHICTFMEASVIKYAYPRSRVDVKAKSLRMLGTYSASNDAGIESASNSLVGYSRGANAASWNGSSVACPNNSGPMLRFYEDTNRDIGMAWDGGCHREIDEYYHWACCINNLD